ncbi:MAG: hypothetical protein WBM44_20485, partial [Waterburya sp.]
VEAKVLNLFKNLVVVRLTHLENSAIGFCSGKLEQVKDRSNTPVPSTRGTRATDWLKHRETQFFVFSGKGGHP